MAGQFPYDNPDINLPGMSEHNNYNAAPEQYSHAMVQHNNPPEDVDGLAMVREMTGAHLAMMREMNQATRMHIDNTRMHIESSNQRVEDRLERLMNTFVESQARELREQRAMFMELLRTLQPPRPVHVEAAKENPTQTSPAVHVPESVHESTSELNTQSLMPAPSIEVDKEASSSDVYKPKEPTPEPVAVTTPESSTATRVTPAEPPATVTTAECLAATPEPAAAAPVPSAEPPAATPVTAAEPPAATPESHTVTTAESAADTSVTNPEPPAPSQRKEKKRKESRETSKPQSKKRKLQTSGNNKVLRDAGKSFQGANVITRLKAIKEEVNKLSPGNRELLRFLLQNAMDTCNGAVFAWPVRADSVKYGSVNASHFVVMDLWVAAIVALHKCRDVEGALSDFSAIAMMTVEERAVALNKIVTRLFGFCFTLLDYLHQHVTVVERLPFCRSTGGSNGKQKDSEVLVMPLDMFIALTVAVDVQPVPVLSSDELATFRNEVLNDDLFKRQVNNTLVTLFSPWRNNDLGTIQRARETARLVLNQKLLKQLGDVFGASSVQEWPIRCWTHGASDQHISNHTVVKGLVPEIAEDSDNGEDSEGDSQEDEDSEDEDDKDEEEESDSDSDYDFNSNV